jgi:TolB protein
LKLRKLVTGSVTLSAVLLTVAAFPAQATYPGGVSRLAFSSTGTGGNGDIYTALPSGSGLQRLTDAKGLDACPTYAPNGRTIAFCSEHSGKFEIWLMDAGGGNQRQLTHRRYNADWPDISPDGRQVAFQTSDGSPARIDIYVTPAAGGKVRRLTGAPGNDICPVFSPRGRTIAFVSERKGSAQIWLMNARDGHDQRQLTRDAAVKHECPDWSPDGKRIAYEAAGDIWVMNADGTAQKKITRTATAEYGPAWSPDGKKLSFVRRLGARKRLYIMSAAGSGQRTLGGPGNQLVASWQPGR